MKIMEYIKRNVIGNPQEKGAGQSAKVTHQESDSPGPPQPDNV